MGNSTFSLLRFLALLFLFNSLHKNYSFQSETPTENNHFHIIELNSLLAASTCSPFTRGLSEEGFLELVHNYGPCFESKHGKGKAFSERDNLERGQLNQIGVKYDEMNTQQFVLNVSLGTPEREFTLAMDTGSSLTWTQCQPCKLGKFSGCYNETVHPIFDPSKSSSLTNVTCPSNTCTLANIPLGSTFCASSTCGYRTDYVDGSIVLGFLAKEKLRIGNDTFNDIIFGCNEAEINISIFHVDGILGLGTDFYSFVEQTSQTYNKIFSYCLPSKESEIGFLKFGEAKPISKSLMFTKLGEHYSIPLVGIKIGSNKLPISFKKGAATIDSGSTVSILPSKDYITFRDAYRKAMSHYQLVKPPEDFDAFDTCYHVNNPREFKLPKVSFLFDDGLVLDIPHIGLALPANSTVVCLPFASNEEFGGGDEVIFANTQQKTLEIVYDLTVGKIGFGYGGCN